jgi:SAM-dependent methyltransferase
MDQAFKDHLRYAWQVLSGSRAAHEQAIAQERSRDIALQLDADRQLRVLDLANGRLRPQCLLLQVAGHQVYGVDLVNRPNLYWTDYAYRLARWLYRRKITITSEIITNPTLVRGDVGFLPFADNSFDLVSSVAAFEHFMDVPAVAAELGRVVRPGGLVWVRIHLFSSLSGGHNTSFVEIPLRSVPRGADPWDHLRRRRLPIHVPLNEWRREEYVEEFGRHFEVIKSYCAMREGEELLTPSVEAELSDYSRDELTCRSFVIVARNAS